MGPGLFHYASSQKIFEKISETASHPPRHGVLHVLMLEVRSDFVRTLARSPREGEEWKVRVMRTMGLRLF